VGASNIFLAPRKGDRDELVRQVGEGIFINQLIGVHAGANPVTGEISLGATGRRIRNGELAEPLREITLAGSALDFLRQVVMVGEDLVFLPFEGSLGAPSLAVEGVMISGKG
jgi:PmbA protein